MNTSMNLKPIHEAPILLFFKDCKSGLMTCLHNTLTIIGISVLCVILSIWIRPTLIETAVHSGLEFIAEEFDRVASIDRNDILAQEADDSTMSSSVSRSIHMIASFFTKSTNDGKAATKDDFTPEVDNNADNVIDAQLKTKPQTLVSNYIARRFHLAQEATDLLVSEAYLVGKEKSIDPHLILGVMAVESGFNPFAESGVGAQGIMQVMSKVHQEKFENFGGVKAALDPLANLRVGVQILKDCIARGGSLEAGLRCYVGSTTEGDGGYGVKVIAEYNRLRDVARGKPVNFTAPPLPLPTVKAAIPNQNQINHPDAADDSKSREANEAQSLRIENDAISIKKAA